MSKQQKLCEINVVTMVSGVVTYLRSGHARLAASDSARVHGSTLVVSEGVRIGVGCGRKSILKDTIVIGYVRIKGCKALAEYNGVGRCGGNGGCLESDTVGYSFPW